MGGQGHWIIKHLNLEESKEHWNNDAHIETTGRGQKQCRRRQDKYVSGNRIEYEVKEVVEWK